MSGSARIGMEGAVDSSTNSSTSFSVWYSSESSYHESNSFIYPCARQNQANWCILQAQPSTLFLYKKKYVQKVGDSATFCSVFMTPVNQAILCLPFLYGCHFYVKLFQNCRRRRKVTWTFFSFASSFFIVLTKHFNSITQPLFKHQSIASRVCSITPTPYSIYLPSIFSYYACSPLHFFLANKNLPNFLFSSPCSLNPTCNMYCMQYIHS